jgi:hypothetical protein
MKTAIEMALRKAFQLGQRYWSCEYSSHRKKADATKAEFDQLVQDTINAALAPQPAVQQEPVIDKSAAIRIATSLGWTPQRTWVGLTPEDKHKPDMGAYVYLNDDWLDGYEAGMEYAETKLKEKNT